MSMLTSVKRTVDRVLGGVLILLMALAVVNVLWQVFTRYVLSDPSSYTEEAARYLLVWISVLGAAYALGSNMHLAIDLLPSMMRGRAIGRLIETLISGVVFLFSLAVFVYGGSVFLVRSWQGGETSPAFGIPVAIVYAALPAAGLLMLLYAVINTLRTWFGESAGAEGED
jgi:TRAP-type C4-dicarboxylate transport system permease small subunit